MVPLLPGSSFFLMPPSGGNRPVKGLARSLLVYISLGGCYRPEQLVS